MNKKHKVLLVILIGAIVAGSFYWFEYNPRQIRKGCANKNMEILVAQLHFVQVMENFLNCALVYFLRNSSGNQDAVKAEDKRVLFELLLWNQIYFRHDKNNRKTKL